MPVQKQMRPRVVEMEVEVAKCDGCGTQHELPERRPLESVVLPVGWFIVAESSGATSKLSFCKWSCLSRYAEWQMELELVKQ